jgi:hypothetical protein
MSESKLVNYAVAEDMEFVRAFLFECAHQLEFELAKPAAVANALVHLAQAMRTPELLKAFVHDEIQAHEGD